MSDQGWAFSDALPDHVSGCSYLHEVYTKARAQYTGRITVPVLWDRQRGTIVNNESAEIIRMLNSEFAALGAAPYDYYPQSLRPGIDDINAVVYANVNNGVYRCGFARSQRAYEGAVTRLFDTLDRLEERLSRTQYLAGDEVTEADWRLFTTLLRFDAVYHGHFKCNVRRLDDYRELSAYLRALYHVPGVSETVDFDHIKRHYYMSHTHINPSRIVPIGPLLDFEDGRPRSPSVPQRPYPTPQ
jgi:putative glutathione S-transferase